MLSNITESLWWFTEAKCHNITKSSSMQRLFHQSKCLWCHLPSSHANMNQLFMAPPSKCHSHKWSRCNP